MKLLLTDLKVLLRVSVKKTRNPANIFWFEGGRIYRKIIKDLDLKAGRVAVKGFAVKYLSLVLTLQCGA
jgi:hypothetical protein